MQIKVKFLMLFTLFFQQNLKLGLKLSFKKLEKESALTLSKTMKLPIYSAVKCYQVLPSAIKWCYQVLSSPKKCYQVLCLERKTKAIYLFDLKRASLFKNQKFKREVEI